MSKVNLVVEMINANPYYVKDELVQRIMNEFSTTRSNAQTYIFNANRKINADVTSTPKEKKTADKIVAAAKKIKPTKAETKVAAIEKTADEIAEIKKANLERMKKVTRNYLPGQVADEATREIEYVSDDEMARRKAAIESFVNYETNDLPSFHSPSKLTMDEVTALV